MRLLHTSEWRFKEFFDCRKVRYAILSHRWGDDEVSYHELMNMTMKDLGGMQIVSPLFMIADAKYTGAGFDKIKRARERARSDGFVWIWIDTCCIDKSNSAELTESINSMFNWYQSAEVCYAYIVDVADGPSEEARDFESLRKSEWFTRGWTLQELLAPRNVSFFDTNWRKFGTKFKMAVVLESITKIDLRLLDANSAGRDPTGVLSLPYGVRMSWVWGRTTSRPEDLAYCLIGLFDVNMSFLYGEGRERAFRRLLAEVVRNSTDESIFAHHGSQLTIPDPMFFHDSGDIEHGLPPIYRYAGVRLPEEPYTITNMGLQKTTAYIEDSHDPDAIRVVAFDCHKSGSDFPVLMAFTRYSSDRVWHSAAHLTQEVKEAKQKIRQSLREGTQPFKVETMLLK